MFARSRLWYAHLIEAIEKGRNTKEILKLMPTSKLSDTQHPITPDILKNVWRSCFASRCRPGGLEKSLVFGPKADANPANMLWGKSLLRHTRFWRDQLLVYLLLEFHQEKSIFGNEPIIMLTPLTKSAGVEYKDARRKARERVFIEMDQRAFAKSQTWIKEQIEAGVLNSSGKGSINPRILDVQGTLYYFPRWA